MAREAQMQKNNFLDAFDEVIKLDEDGAELMQKIAGKAKNAADTAVAKKQVKTQQANDQAKATSESLKPIMDLLQPIANAQNQFDDNSIKQISDLINKLPNLDNGVKKQINQILNQQKAALQQQAATQAKTEQQDVPANNATATENNATEENPANATEQGNSGAGDPNKVANNDQIAPKINVWVNGDNPMVSIDDLIAYLQWKKERDQQKS